MINELNIVSFDGVCNLCNSTVSLLIKYDPEYKLHFAAQQTTAGIAIMNHHGIQQQHNSVVFIKENKVFYKSGLGCIGLALFSRSFFAIGYMTLLQKIGIEFLVSERTMLFQLMQIKKDFYNAVD